MAPSTGNAELCVLPVTIIYQPDHSLYYEFPNTLEIWARPNTKYRVDQSYLIGTAGFALKKTAEPPSGHL